MLQQSALLQEGRQTLQNLASLVTDYKVSLLILPACQPACISGLNQSRETSVQILGLSAVTEKYHPGGPVQ